MASQDGQPDVGNAVGEAKASQDNAVQLPATRVPVVLAGTELFSEDKQTHVGLSLNMTSAGIPSSLVIPDVAEVPKGGAVYITAPIKLEGKNLKAFLIDKKILTKKKADDDADNPEVNEPVGKFLNIATISMDAFYFTTNGPLLMAFELKTESEDGKGLIESLTENASLGKLFDITGASVRVFRSTSEADYKKLQTYAAALAK
jgi:hypothetical protein